MAYQSLNPYDGTILKTFEELTDMQLNRSKLPVELAVIGGSIVFSVGLGLGLVFANGRRQTR